MNKMEMKPYKGYIVIPRALLLFFLGKPFCLLEFGIYIAFASICDWDVHHRTYACITQTNTQLASLWGCDASTVWRYKKRLIKAGLLTSENGLFKIKYFSWFEMSVAKQLAKISIASVQELIAVSQGIIAKEHRKIASLQSSQDQNPAYNFSVSSKENIGGFNKLDESISDEETEQIIREIDKQRR